MANTTPYAIQHLLDREKWDCDEVRDTLRAYIWETLAAPQAVIVIDETCFLKKGHKAVGVQRAHQALAHLCHYKRRCPLAGHLQL